MLLSIKIARAMVVVGGETLQPGQLMHFQAARREAGQLHGSPKGAAGHSCSQCGTQIPPAWRAGPQGPKTLCNACGVRWMRTKKK
jgi:hypothetical protein